MNLSKEALYPLLFEPVLKDYIWGGRNLESKLGRRLPANGQIAESWEIAAHPDGVSVVSNGRFAGKPLTELHTLLGLDLIGTNNAWAQARQLFPLLIKLLDANDKLSVQVHPDDAYALAHEGNELGKTEMWVVLDATPDAAVILGVKEGTTPAQFREAIHEGTLEQWLHRIPVQTGDVVCVPAGSLHAILGGLLIAEIQQNSNTTYRVYDWNRTRHGQKRPLHLEQALDVINFDQVEPDLPSPTLVANENGVRRTVLCRNQYFATERVEMVAGSNFEGHCDGRSLEIWGVISGMVTINGVGLTAVQFTLLPAAMGQFTIHTHQATTLLRTYVESAQ